MYKSSVRIIKRNNIAALAKPVIIDHLTEARIVRHKRIELVNTWVTESQETARLEKSFSESRIRGWKMISP